jgi:hypothetical protein
MLVGKSQRRNRPLCRPRYRREDKIWVEGLDSSGSDCGLMGFYEHGKEFPGSKTADSS